MLLGFLHYGGIEQWSYAIAADLVVQGDRFMRFTPKDIDFNLRVISAEVWQDGAWRPKRSFFPVAIKNFELNKGKDPILNWIPYTLGKIVKKDDQMALFSHVPSIAAYIPVSLSLDAQLNIVEKIKDWGAGLLKPVRGRLGQGIFFLRMIDQGFEINENGVSKQVDEQGLLDFLALFYADDAKPYILQQFAAGTGPLGRYFNIRVIVTKSGDGDWHPCSFVMSLLAKPNSIIANRDAGAQNIDLHAWLVFRYGDQVQAIYDELFAAAVKIVRVLDDSVNASAEEIALDMAIDNQGKIWLHEANWRGGMWLFEDDVGLYRHAGAWWSRLGQQSLAGADLDKSAALDILLTKRVSMRAIAKSLHAGNDGQSGVITGIYVPRKTLSSIQMLVSAISLGLPILSVSSSASFRAVLRRAGEALTLIRQQTPEVMLPFLLVRGGACVHDPLDERGYLRWLKDELLEQQYINEQDLQRGYSLSKHFIRRSIADSLADLRVKKLDAFILEGVSLSLSDQVDWQKTWQEVAVELTRAIQRDDIQHWGIALDVRQLNTHVVTNVLALMNALDGVNVIKPKLLCLDVDEACSGDWMDSVLSQLHELIEVDLQVVLSAPTAPLVHKAWYQSHPTVDGSCIQKLKENVPDGVWLLSPATDMVSLELSKRYLFEQGLDGECEAGSPWIIRHQKPYWPAKLLSEISVTQTVKPQQPVFRWQQTLATMATFDHRQWFRFFVDGRFQKTYHGWRGYENNEPGSVSGLLKAYAYMLDHFDISQGLTGSYIRVLHALCMKGVKTRNGKSTPGDMRYIDVGFNLHAIYSTKASLQELLDWHSQSAHALFHTRGFDVPASRLDAEQLVRALKDKKKLRFRPWYPTLDEAQKAALSGQSDLSSFYRVKHEIQMLFAQKVDEIVNAYNQEIARAASEQQRLLAIARVVRYLEMLHPFPDGNGRTFVAVLMNHLLMFNGFLPAILHDPNIDIELSVAEFADEIGRGIEHTQQLLNDPEMRLFDYAISDASTVEVEEFSALSQSFIIKLSRLASLGVQMPALDTVARGPYVLYMPEQMATVMSGTWLNITTDRLSMLRFESISVDIAQLANQLMFIRNTAHWLSDLSAFKHYVADLVDFGVVAVAVDHLELAVISQIPALLVEDIDDALAMLARETKKEVNCKSVALMGTQGKTTAKRLLASLLSKQAKIHTMLTSEVKTPQLMVSLANLRVDDQVEIVELSIDGRPNPASYRARAVMPDVVLVTQFEASTEEEAYRLAEAYAATTDGVKDAGVYLLPSNSPYLSILVAAIRARKAVSIQTFGEQATDIAQLTSAVFDSANMSWYVSAHLLEDAISYRVKGAETFWPMLSLGVLLAVANLGYDYQQVSFLSLDEA